MITDDPLVRHWLGEHVDLVDDSLSLALAVGLTVLGWWMARSASGPPAARERA
jgi:hypothetical protein